MCQAVIVTKEVYKVYTPKEKLRRILVRYDGAMIILNKKKLVVVYTHCFFPPVIRPLVLIELSVSKLNIL